MATIGVLSDATVIASAIGATVATIGLLLSQSLQHQSNRKLQAQLAKMQSHQLSEAARTARVENSVRGFLDEYSRALLEVNRLQKPNGKLRRFMPGRELRQVKGVLRGVEDRMLTHLSDIQLFCSDEINALAVSAMNEIRAYLMGIAERRNISGVEFHKKYRVIRNGFRDEMSRELEIKDLP